MIALASPVFFRRWREGGREGRVTIIPSIHLNRLVLVNKHHLLDVVYDLNGFNLGVFLSRVALEATLTNE